MVLQAPVASEEWLPADLETKATSMTGIGLMGKAEDDLWESGRLRAHSPDAVQ